MVKERKKKENSTKNNPIRESEDNVYNIGS